MRASVTFSLAMVALMSAGACASLRPARGGHGELESAAKRALNGYLECLYVHADAMASGTGEPSEIAERAVAHCERQFSGYCTATGEYFTAAAAPDDRAAAQERARARCAETRADARDGLLSRIVAERERLDERRARTAREASYADRQDGN